MGNITCLYFAISWQHLRLSVPRPTCTCKFPNRPPMRQCLTLSALTNVTVFCAFFVGTRHKLTQMKLDSRGVHFCFASPCSVFMEISLVAEGSFISLRGVCQFSWSTPLCFWLSGLSVKLALGRGPCAADTH